MSISAKETVVRRRTELLGSALLCLPLVAVRPRVTSAFGLVGDAVVVSAALTSQPASAVTIVTLYVAKDGSDVSK